jgi:hypothetical protein
VGPSDARCHQSFHQHGRIELPWWDRSGGLGEADTEAAHGFPGRPIGGVDVAVGCGFVAAVSKDALEEFPVLAGLHLEGGERVPQVVRPGLGIEIRLLEDGFEVPPR